MSGPVKSAPCFRCWTLIDIVIGGFWIEMGIDKSFKLISGCITNPSSLQSPAAKDCKRRRSCRDQPVDNLSSRRRLHRSKLLDRNPQRWTVPSKPKCIGQLIGQMPNPSSPGDRSSKTPWQELGTEVSAAAAAAANSGTVLRPIWEAAKLWASALEPSPQGDPRLRKRVSDSG